MEPPETSKWELREPFFFARLLGSSWSNETRLPVVVGAALNRQREMRTEATQNTVGMRPDHTLWRRRQCHDSTSITAHCTCRTPADPLIQPRRPRRSPRHHNRPRIMRISCLSTAIGLESCILLKVTYFHISTRVATAKILTPVKNTRGTLSQKAYRKHFWCFCSWTFAYMIK